MAQLDLEVRASTPQESPDTVFLAGHFRLHYQPLGEDITRTLFLGYAKGIQGIELPSFDLPALRA
jgi:hypothetical protein